MLSQAIGSVLPFAVGVALSPIPIVAVVLMLATPRGRLNGAAFALGWVAGLTAVAVVVLVLTGGSDDPGTTSDSVAWGKLALGVLFLVLALRTWRSRPVGDAEPEMPAWMARVDTFSPGRSLGLGLVLSAANPKNLTLAAAAGASIAQSGVSAGGDVVAVAVFVVLGSVSVAGLVLFAVAAGDRSDAPLAAIRSTMARHNAVIMVVLLLVLGAKLVGDGLGGAFS